LGNSLNFDGVNDFVTTPIIQNSTNYGAWTIECWVNGAAAPSGANYSGPAYGDNMGIIWNHVNAAFRGAATVTTSNTTYAASFGTLAGATWYHLAATFDGTNLKSYKNGVLITTTVVSGTMVNSTSPLLIGKHPTLANYFHGSIDDIKVWNTARGCIQISSRMNEDLVGNEIGLTVYYDCNQGISGGVNYNITTLVDALENTNHGTLSGFGLNGTATSNFINGAPHNNQIVCTPLQLAIKYSFNSSNANNDLSTNNNDEVTGATLTTDRFGNANKAYAFSGNTTDKINFGDVQAFNNAQKYTLCMWLNQAQLDVIGGIWNKSKNLGGSWDSFIQGRTYNNGNLYYSDLRASLGQNAISNAGLHYSLNVTANQWFHYALVYDGTQTGDANRVKTYLNGVYLPNTYSNEQIFQSTTPNLSGGNFIVGQANLGYLGGNGWNGKIDDIFLFTNALGTSQIDNIKNLPAPPNCSLTTANTAANTTCGANNGSVSTSLTGTYLWSNGATTQAINNVAAGAYSVTVTANGCTATATSTVAVSTALSTTNTAANTTCGANNGSVFTSLTGTYLWSNGATTQVISNVAAGAYSVTVTSGGCTATASSTVNASTVLSPPLISETGNTLSTPTGFAYVWYLNGSVIANQTSNTITYSQNGNCTVEISDGKQCMATSAIYTIVSVGISDVASLESNILITPNPVDENSMLRVLSPKNELVNVVVIDVTGKVIFTESLTTNTNYNINKFMNVKSTGIYFIKATTSKGLITKKFLKK